MKRKISVIGLDGKTITGEVPIRDLSHLDAQIRFPAKTFRDRTKYTRKSKHKIKYEEE